MDQPGGSSRGRPFMKGHFMTAYNIDLITEQPDTIYVDVARRFNVAIIRTKTGLELRIYPRTDGEVWDAPFTTFEVDESQIVALEAEMREEQP